MSHPLWINGERVESQGGSMMAIENPATGEQIAEVTDASGADVDRAVQAANEAFSDGRWSRLTPGERSLILWRLADLIEQNAEELARVESENTGKPYSYVSLGGDMPFAVDNLRFFAAAARDTHGHSAGEYAKGYTSMYRREPVGVVGQIAPWNYPLMMAIWKIGPALAAGCTVVLKPAPTTPLTTLMLAELAAEAGMPEGVFNVITGGNEAGQALVEHPDVRMVSLTGSTDTGKKIMKTAADTLKRVHLELGGKAPFIVFDDADAEEVASKAAAAATLNTGQDCTAATRVYVEEGKLATVQEAVVEAMRAVKIGLPFDDDTADGAAHLARAARARAGLRRACPRGRRDDPDGRRRPCRLWRRLLLRADRDRRCGAERGNRPERNLWPRPHHQHLPRRAGRPAPGQRCALRAGGLGVDQRCGAGHAAGERAGIWHRLDQRPHSR